MKILLTAMLLATSAAAMAGNAFFVREESTGGMTKQCVYDYLGSTYTITVSNVAMCPLTLPVR